MSTSPEPAPRAARGRRARGVRESVGSIVLGFELVILFLGTLVAWGLHAAPAVLVITGGAVLIVLSAVAILTLRWPLGTWIGFAVQLLTIASGIWVHAMLIVGVLFLALWIYAMYAAARAERIRSAQQQHLNETENQ